MKSYIFTALFVVAAILFTQNTLSEPSRLFTQQTAAIEPNGSAALDLDYPFTGAGFVTGLRIGSFDGVVMINSHPETGTRTGFDASSIGYKKPIGNNLSAYGVISYYHNEGPNYSGTDFAIGAAYTATSGALTYNINPEFITDDQAGTRGLKNTLFLKGAILMPLSAIKANNSSFVAELDLENSSYLDTILNLGIRWKPRKDMTLDFVFCSNRNSPGGVQSKEQGIPGWIKANIRF